MELTDLLPKAGRHLLGLSLPDRLGVPLLSSLLPLTPDTLDDFLKGLMVPFQPCELLGIMAGLLGSGLELLEIEASLLDDGLELILRPPCVLPRRLLAPAQLPHRERQGSADICKPALHRLPLTPFLGVIQHEERPLRVLTGPPAQGWKPLWPTPAPLSPTPPPGQAPPPLTLPASSTTPANAPLSLSKWLRPSSTPTRVPLSPPPPPSPSRLLERAFPFPPPPRPPSRPLGQLPSSPPPPSPPPPSEPPPRSTPPPRAPPPPHCRGLSPRRPEEPQGQQLVPQGRPRRQRAEQGSDPTPCPTAAEGTGGVAARLEEVDDTRSAFFGASGGTKSRGAAL
uniref:Uncharacterized protein n=1 Tax=Setaria viridis TaxID=4556 RepID=A0A4U6UIQ1_SETVI|nr:hypothetical protein SEVIR_5G177590v2 [Setaria viridis]